MVRILALDVGDKRIGVAVSDTMGWTAQGLHTLEKSDKGKLFSSLRSILEQYRPEKVVVGLPVNMNGTLGPQAEKVKQFVQELKGIYSGEIVYWDERLTTLSAHRLMIDAGVRRNRRKQKADKIAAVLILQSYLDYLNNKKKEG
ncbi:putative Holliday junction resolvase [Caldicoprobacter guelmensis]|nr:putative Holliday junction resolvase [Caldicoprobacter guelmensis]